MKKEKAKPTEQASVPAAATPATTTAQPFKAIRRAGVPICAIETPDPSQSVQNCKQSMNGKFETTIVISWNIGDGISSLNAPGAAYIEKIPEDVIPSLTNPSEFLRYVTTTVPVGGVIFFANAHRFWDNEAIVQGIWNARDKFKACGTTLVLLCPTAKLPLELKNDVPVFSEVAPDEWEIGNIIDSICKDAEIDPAKIDRKKVTDGLLGYLSAFGVEQSLALSLTKEGVSIEQLWNLKIQALKQCAGLEVSLPSVGFDGLSGCAGVKDLIRLYLAGRKQPRVCFWLDELEKMVAGGSTDTSGTTQAMLEQFLFWTESRKVDGILLLGVPGAGKSETCRTAAGEAKVPLLRASLSTVKGSLVGQSEANLKNMLASVDAVAQGRVLMIATCNSIEALTPEVMARFKLAVFFYDYPDENERADLWKFYMKKYELTGSIPDSFNWVGREIASCCERAWMFNVSLEQASKTVVPVSVANAAKMDVLRRSVSGRFLSAAHPGIYRVETQQTFQSGGRRIAAE